MNSLLEVRPADRADGIPAFRLIGELDVSGAPVLRAALEDVLRRSDDLVLDLSELAFMDSGGVHAMVDISRRLEERGRLIVSGPLDPVRRVLELTQVARILPNFEVVDG